MNNGFVKKISLFFAVFFLLFSLYAEDAAQENKETPEKQDVSCGCGEEKTEKPADFFYLLSSIGLYGLGIDLGMSADFHVKQIGKGKDVYLGFKADFRFGRSMTHSDRVYDIYLPLQMKSSFNFKQRAPYIDTLALWITLGADLVFEGQYERVYVEEIHLGKDNYKYDGLTRVDAAWGIGLDVILDYNIVFTAGFNSFKGKYPILSLAFGYRF